jgi:hypothetical protein
LVGIQQSDLSGMDEFKKIVSFWLDCLQKALFDTLAFCDLRTRRAVLPLIPAAAVLLFLWWTSTASEHPEFLYHLKTYVALIKVTLASAAVVFVGELFAAAYRVRMERFLEQSFLLLFGPDAPCVHPQPLGTLYRLGIKNLSMVNPIEQMVAEVTNIEPNPPAFLPLPLHIMHDNPPAGGHYQTSFTLGGDHTQFVDVVAILNIQGAPQFF